MARVLVAMSGGVDSSVAAALLLEEGHDVTGVTMKLWGGVSDSGCCSVSDVEDARRVAAHLGITHRVFNFSSDFEASVVKPYAAAHSSGLTPNPCIECNRHLKFDRLLGRAERLGFDAVATGHHARVVAEGGRLRLLRGADRYKDQSYVLSMLDQRRLALTMLPVGRLTKARVRQIAAALGLRTADKPDSQDVCFIPSARSERVPPVPGSSGGRAGFLAERIELHAGRVRDVATGQIVGQVPAIELVTVGQRRGMGAGRDGRRRYAIEVDPAAREVTVGPGDRLSVRRCNLRELTWVDGRPPAGSEVQVQSSAHGVPVPAVLADAAVWFRQPQRRVAPGQTVALYDGDSVLGAGLAC